MDSLVSIQRLPICRLRESVGLCQQTIQLILLVLILLNAWSLFYFLKNMHTGCKR